MQRVCDMRYSVISAHHFAFGKLLPDRRRVTVIYKGIRPPGAVRPRLCFFLLGPSRRYTMRVSRRTLVARQRLELVCVPLKVDTFQIVLHFKATYAG